MKQTAVEWLVENAEDFFGGLIAPLIFEQAKQCALIAVDEIINCDYFFKTLEDTKEFTKYWVEVQNEIINL